MIKWFVKKRSIVTDTVTRVEWRDRNNLKVPYNSFIHKIILRCLWFIEKQTFWKGHICINKSCKRLETKFCSPNFHFKKQTLLFGRNWTLFFWLYPFWIKPVFSSLIYIKYLEIFFQMGFFFPLCYSNKFYKCLIISEFWIYYWKFYTKNSFIKHVC